MKNKLALLTVSLILTLLSLASLHVHSSSSSYPLATIINVAKAAETVEERAHEMESGNAQNGFSPANPEETKQVTKQSEKEVAINLLAQNLIQSGSPLQGNPAAPIAIVE